MGRMGQCGEMAWGWHGDVVGCRPPAPRDRADWRVWLPDDRSRVSSCLLCWVTPPTGARATSRQEEWEVQSPWAGGVKPKCGWPVALFPPRRNSRILTGPRNFDTKCGRTVVKLRSGKWTHNVRRRINVSHPTCIRKPLPSLSSVPSGKSLRSPVRLPAT